MAQQLQQRVEEEAPPLDPEAVRRAYRLHRAQRRARVERRRQRRRAGRRFWLTMLILLAGCAALALVVWAEVQRLFGL